MPSFDSVDPRTSQIYTVGCNAVYLVDRSYEDNEATFRGRNVLVAFALLQNDARLHSAIEEDSASIWFLISRSW